MSRKIYLSVDFDYFCHEEDWWDWGHGETSLYQDIAWFTRVRQYEETKFEKFANPQPKDFWSKLVELGYNFDECESIRVSDSHLFAAHDFLDLTPGRVEIVNFDAHHDMGYADWKTLKKKWIDPSRVDCSNWLLVLLWQLEHLTAACVYPEWKGLREVSKDRKPTWEQLKLKDRFRYGVFSEQYARELAGDVVGVFIARSGAWMPPWHDRAFVDFVEDLAGETGLSAEVPYEEKERCDPMQPRKFDLEAALAHDRDVRVMIENMNAENKKAAGGK